MLKDFLDSEIYNQILKAFSFNDITEIRLRVNEKIIVAVKNKKYYLKDENNNFLICTKQNIENFITRACHNSVYAYNNNIIQGYITLKNGIRVGLSGNVVVENNKVVTIKDFNSLNIRIPHIIKNCSLIAYDYLVTDEVKNTLIVSPPGAGKTTFLRDLIFQLYNHNLAKNVLIADERNEICATNDAIPQINLGGFCDIYTNCTKKYAFKNGIRSMCPDVIVTDEIDLDCDLQYITEAINCGVNVVATIHAKDLNQLKNKPGFSEIFEKHLFSRYVFLTNDLGPGTLTYIYDDKLNCIYSR